jgi:hypothetical protein
MLIPFPRLWVFSEFILQSGASTLIICLFRSLGIIQDNNIRAGFRYKFDYLFNFEKIITDDPTDK